MGQRLINNLKQITENVNNASSFSDYYIGTVVSDEPLIQLGDSTQKPLFSQAVIIPAEFSSYEVEVEGEFTGELTGSFTGRMTINNKLKTGEKVLLLKKTGGQKYTVIGKINDT